MREIVINRCYGGFGLSRVAFLRLRELGCQTALEEPDWGEECSDGSGPRKQCNMDAFGKDVPRDDALLVRVVKDLGERASGPLSHLKIISIPGDVEWEINDHDGVEWVAEQHRTWS